MPVRALFIAGLHQRKYATVWSRDEFVTSCRIIPHRDNYSIEKHVYYTGINL
jgi:hypothetical protein